MPRKPSRRIHVDIVVDTSTEAESARVRALRLLIGWIREDRAGNMARWAEPGDYGKVGDSG